MDVQLAPLDAALWDKHAALLAQLRRLGRVLVAYSGGVDSAFLAKVAFDALGAGAVAVTARSASLMGAELDAAVRLAAEIGIEHRIIDTEELSSPAYVKNDADRCYHCKSELFDAAALLAAEGGAVVVDGFNADDRGDHRPGARAAAERAVRHPLAEAELSKAEVRSLSRALGLPTWSKPQLACLASRIPYGVEVTPERLGRIEAVELALRAEGFFSLRARLVAGNDELVRIELGAAEFSQLADPARRARIVRAAKRAGFRYVTVDLEGFYSGRMNEALVQLGGRKAPRPVEA